MTNNANQSRYRTYPGSPVHPVEDLANLRQGLTKREYFMSNNVAAILAREGSRADPEVTCEAAYKITKQMIETLNANRSANDVRTERRIGKRANRVTPNETTAPLGPDIY